MRGADGRSIHQRCARRPRSARILACGSGALALSGCAHGGAPAFVFFGAYVPAWMLCALVGVVVALSVRAGMLVGGLAQALPFPLGFCAGCGLIAALAAWWLGFGR